MPTVEVAPDYIANGATNRLDMLERARLSTSEAEVELARIDVG